MRKSKIVKIMILLAGILFCLPFNLFAADLKIGVIVPLSGGGAFYGSDAKRATELALDYLGSKVTVGGKAYDLKPVYYDATTPSAAVQGLRQMATVEGINLIMGPFGSSLANAGATVNEKEKMLLMAVSGDTKTTKSGNKLLVRYQSTPSACAPPYGEFIMKQGLDTMAILYDSTDWGVDWAKNVEKGYKAAGGKIVYMESAATLKETDYYAMATKIRGLNPKALMIIAWDEPSAMIAKQAREIGYKGTFCFTNQLRDKGIKLAGAQNLAGSFTGGGTAMGTKSMPAGMTKYFEMFKKKYTNQTPYGPGMLIFDQWIALAKAMELAGTTTDVYKIRAALDKATAKMPIQVYGEYKGITPGGQAWGNETVITKIGQDGVPTIISSLPITYKDAIADEPKM